MLGAPRVESSRASRSCTSGVHEGRHDDEVGPIAAEVFGRWWRDGDLVRRLRRRRDRATRSPRACAPRSTASPTGTRARRAVVVSHGGAMAVGITALCRQPRPVVRLAAHPRQRRGRRARAHGGRLALRVLGRDLARLTGTARRSARQTGVRRPSRERRIDRCCVVLVLAVLAAAVLGARCPGRRRTPRPTPTRRAGRPEYAPVVVVREQPGACGTVSPTCPRRSTTVLGQTDVVLRGPEGQSISAPTADGPRRQGRGLVPRPARATRSTPGCDYERWFDQASQGTAPTVYARVATDPDHPGSPRPAVLVLLGLQRLERQARGRLGDGPALVRRRARVDEALDVGSDERRVRAARGLRDRRRGPTRSCTRTATTSRSTRARARTRRTTRRRSGSGRARRPASAATTPSRRARVVRPEVVVLPATRARRATSGSTSPGAGGRRRRRSTTARRARTPRPSGSTRSRGRSSRAARTPWRCRPWAGPAVTGFCELTEAGSLLFIAAARPARRSSSGCWRCCWSSS